MEYTHNCIKCSTEYKDTDIDAYYCQLCILEKKRTAQEIDKKIKSTNRRQIKSDLQIFDEIRKSTGRNFVSISDLGIKL